MPLIPSFIFDAAALALMLQLADALVSSFASISGPFGPLCAAAVSMVTHDHLWNFTVVVEENLNSEGGKGIGAPRVALCLRLSILSSPLSAAPLLAVSASHVDFGVALFMRAEALATPPSSYARHNTPTRS